MNWSYGHGQYKLPACQWQIQPPRKPLPNRTKLISALRNANNYCGISRTGMLLLLLKHVSSLH